MNQNCKTHAGYDPKLCKARIEVYYWNLKTWSLDGISDLVSASRPIFMSLSLLKAASLNF